MEPSTSKVSDISDKALYETLCRISNLKPLEMFREICSMKNNLVEKLNNEQNFNFYITLLKILSSISSPALESSEILILIAHKTKLHKHLCNFILSLSLTSDVRELAEFWENLLKYCNNVTDYIPSVAVNFVPKIIQSIKMVKNVAADKITLTHDEFDHLINKIDSLTIRDEENQTNKNGFVSFNDFRLIDIFPKYEEIMPLFQMPTLYKNIISGKYENVEHYLNIHFRLLREDFIKPIREDFQQYLNNPATRLNNIKIYKNVEILEQKVIDKQFGYVVQLSKQELAGNPSEFMEGSLIFLIDQFRHISFGTMLRQNKELLPKSQIFVRLNCENIMSFASQTKLMMAESTIYFDQYLQVLKALKTFQENNFPLKEYLIDVTNLSHLPDYLPKDFDFDKFIANKMPSLNESQYAAYKNALLNKLAIIQGPPGTGKTYLGLQIAATLLKSELKLYYNGPILVVCYRNHALDQFLEGLSSVTEQIVRIGSRSSNTKLDKYNIRQWRKTNRTNRDCENYFLDLILNAYDFSDDGDYGYRISFAQRDAISERIAFSNSERYNHLLDCYNNYRDGKDLSILRDAAVVGMTTTGAARMHAVLQQLKCPIVIVEEAAEVLEAHVVAALSKNCQHLILIGDHKQLRPATADYKMGTDYKLGISLFERMVLNNIQCNTLRVQHRMHPNIAKLVSPIIYPDLKNHKTVYDYPPVKGLDKNLFFIQHTHKESATSASKANEYEAKYLISLARYLVLNNPEPDKITILSAYLAQYYELVKLSKKDESLQGVKIEVLDNYQGEENDIVLLSLVRNNDEGRIGFLRMENRVCVALSRAKHALYIMGNIELLASNSEVWKKVKTELIAQDALGTDIVVRCEEHLDRAATIKDIIDFTKIHNGGCDIPCTENLDCGHKCPQNCHRTSHSIYKCMEDCEKILCELNHKCPLRCHADCMLCMVPKQITLKCGHEHEVPCHVVPDKYLCPIELRIELPCKHQVLKPCHVDVKNFECPIKCNATLTCGHSCILKCHAFNDPNHINYKCEITCYVPARKCSFEGESKHLCQTLCYQSVQLCTIEVEKTRPKCSHKIKCKCYQDPDKRLCTQKCSKILNCGHACNRKCGTICGIEKCMELVNDLSRKAICGHIISSLPCYVKDCHDKSKLTTYCKVPCDVLLKCGHKCMGSCANCQLGRLHVECAAKCTKQLICGHICPTLCNEICKPCPLNCTYKCPHASCDRICGAPCFECNEPCTRRCKHQQCKRQCWQICSVPPCTEPCDELLKCGHPCVGYCGEQCPNLCRICDEKKLMAKFFGNEDGYDVRFIQLACGDIFESEGLKTWLLQAASNVTMLCPKCNNSILPLQRYNECIKSAYKKLDNKSLKLYGDVYNIQIQKMELKKYYTELLKRSVHGIHGIQGTSTIKACIDALNALKYDNNNSQFFDKVLEMWAIRYKIIKKVANLAIKTEDRTSLEELNKLFVYLRTTNTPFLSEQQIHDIKAELARIKKI